MRIYAHIYAIDNRAKKNGVFGFIKGIYQGAVSLVLKPTIGIYDMLRTFAEVIFINYI